MSTQVQYYINTINRYQTDDINKELIKYISVSDVVNIVVKYLSKCKMCSLLICKSILCECGINKAYCCEDTCEYCRVCKSCNKNMRYLKPVSYTWYNHAVQKRGYDKEYLLLCYVCILKKVNRPLQDNSIIYSCGAVISDGYTPICFNSVYKYNDRCPTHKTII